MRQFGIDCFEERVDVRQGDPPEVQREERSPANVGWNTRGTT